MKKVLIEYSSNFIDTDLRILQEFKKFTGIVGIVENIKKHEKVPNEN